MQLRLILRTIVFIVLSQGILKCKRPAENAEGSIGVEIQCKPVITGQHMMLSQRTSTGATEFEDNIA